MPTFGKNAAKVEASRRVGKRPSPRAKVERKERISKRLVRFKKIYMADAIKIAMLAGIPVDDITDAMLMAAQAAKKREQVSNTVQDN